MLAAQIVEGVDISKLVTIRKPREPDPLSDVLQLKVLATCRYTYHHLSSRQLRECFAPSNIPGINGVGETSRGERFFFLMQGSFAEYVNVPKSRCFPFPRGINICRAAALVWTTFPTWLALRPRCERRPMNFSVLIMGATSIHGRLAVLLARNLGAERIVGCARRNSGLRAMDLDDYIVLQDETASTDFSALGHVDLILDYIYGPATTHLLESLKPGGRVQYVHVHGDDTGSKINLPASVLDSSDLTIQGSGGYDLSTFLREFPGLLINLMTIHSETIIVKRLKEVETEWHAAADWVVFVP